MNYSLMGDDDIIKDLADKMDRLRIARQLKDTDLAKAAGISRKTLYNFRQGDTGLSLKNFIRILQALGEVERLQLLFQEKEQYSPLRGEVAEAAPKRVRDKKRGGRSFTWGDEA